MDEYVSGAEDFLDYPGAAEPRQFEQWPIIDEIIDSEVVRHQRIVQAGKFAAFYFMRLAKLLVSLADGSDSIDRSFCRLTTVS